LECFYQEILFVICNSLPNLRTDFHRSARTAYISEGSAPGALAAGLMQNIDAHYFLRGPAQCMAEIQTNLEQQNTLAD